VLRALAIRHAVFVPRMRSGSRNAMSLQVTVTAARWTASPATSTGLLTGLFLFRAMNVEGSRSASCRLRRPNDKRHLLVVVVVAGPHLHDLELVPWLGGAAARRDAQPGWRPVKNQVTKLMKACMHPSLT
jgi:hypothetical protein